MNTDPRNLAKQFHDISDEELLFRCRAGSLTEIAQSIALKELAVRGLKLPEPVITEFEADHYEGDFETVARFLNPTDAHIVCACLEAAGLPSVVADANLVQTNALWAIAIGGARVLAPASRIAEAKEIVEAFNRGDFTLPEDGDYYRE